MNEYLGISSIFESQITRNGSRFISRIYPVKSQEEVKMILNELKIEFPDATHICYAAVLDIDKKNHLFSDSGEPSNSAGRPILQALLSSNTTFILGVVIRYYGGKKLGIPGLIEAYNSATLEVLQLAEICSIKIKCKYKLRIDIVYQYQIFNVINKLKIKDYELTNEEFIVNVDMEIESEFIDLIKKLRCDIQVEKM
jgi:uncharacterized YigZ family protein